MKAKKTLILLLAGSAMVLSAQASRPGAPKTSPVNRPSTVTQPSTPSTQTFRDAKGRVTGTATTTTSPTGSKVTTYQTSTGKPVTSSTEFPKEGTGTTVQKVQPKTTSSTTPDATPAPTLPPEKKEADKKD